VLILGHTAAAMKALIPIMIISTAQFFKFIAIIKSMIAALMVATGVSGAFFKSFLIGAAPIVAVIASIGIAIWALIDAFTEADLKIINFFRNIQIGGESLGTWLDVLATRIRQIWDWVVNKSILIWETFWISFKDGGRQTYRFFLRLGQLISNVFWKVVQNSVDAIASMMRKSAEGLSRIRGISQETIDSIINAAALMEGKVTEGSIKASKSYEKAIKDSLLNSGEEWKKYYEKVAELDRQHTENTAMWAAARTNIFVPEATMAVQTAQSVNEQLKQILGQRTETRKKQTDDEIAIENQKRQALITTTNAWFGVAAAAAELGGKKMFKTYKAFAIAEAASAAYLAFNKTLAVGGPFSAPLAYSYLAMGLLNVRRIAMMKPGGGAGGVGGGGGGGGISNFAATPATTPSSTGALEREREEERRPQVHVVVENIHGTADEAFADLLADSIADRIKDGRDFGTTSG
jgi:hypothetical protein